jgi:signal transduction histidine kinase
VVTNTDATKLRQILFNLLNNALKFTPTGRVETGFSAIDGNLLFYVKDTGIGIREELHATVFERFRQVENSISMQQGGTGLGLSISKSLVELLGGTIWLESEPGKGSTFFFTIPYLATEEKLANQNDFQMAKQASWIGKNILIAEDDETNYGIP